jgi:hypothetical protein
MDQVNQSDQVRRTHRARRAALGLLIGAALIVAGCGDTRLRVIFDNQSSCDGVTVRLINTQIGEPHEDRLPLGAQREFEVQPDVSYRYEIDFTTATTPGDAFRCTLIEEGQVRLPRGSIPQRFILESQLPATPAP